MTSPDQQLVAMAERIARIIVQKHAAFGPFQSFMSLDDVEQLILADPYILSLQADKERLDQAEKMLVINGLSGRIGIYFQRELSQDITFRQALDTAINQTKEKEIT